MGYSQRPRDGDVGRFEPMQLEWEPGEEVYTQLKVYREEARSILSRNDSPDLPFAYTLNPYRGCAHACAYCYARPYHEYLGYGLGSDFDTQIIAKVNAPTLLQKEIRSLVQKGESLAFSGITDAYQPVEASLKLTRACLAICLEAGVPVGVISKSLLMARDIDVFQDLQKYCGFHVVVSIPVLDTQIAKVLEPYAPSPEARFRLIRKLADAGLTVGLSLAPVIPGLTDSMIPELLKRGADSGATHTFYTLLRLPHGVKALFLDRLKAGLPDFAGKVEHHVRETREGNLYQSEFNTRFTGQGPQAELIAQLFHTQARRLGYQVGESQMRLLPKESRAKPSGPSQMDLFADLSLE